MDLRERSRGAQPTAHWHASWPLWGLRSALIDALLDEVRLDAGDDLVDYRAIHSCSILLQCRHVAERPSAIPRLGTKEWRATAI